MYTEKIVIRLVGENEQDVKAAYEQISEALYNEATETCLALPGVEWE